ncbi:hypothetical protein KSP40_PGU016284 [Platanthera guangdongensis]|uniref:Uncharacterized protein n=1 Tax=Platanthera guangdongensis TaxID=2320717 RepID=A0ABR2LPI3_9ASPA
MEHLLPNFPISKAETNIILHSSVDLGEGSSGLIKSYLGKVGKIRSRQGSALPSLPLHSMRGYFGLFHYHLHLPLLLHRLAIVLLTHFPPLYIRRTAPSLSKTSNSPSCSSYVASPPIPYPSPPPLLPLPSKSGSHAAGGKENHPLLSSTNLAEIPSGKFTIRLGPSRSFDLYIPNLLFFGRSASTTLERSAGFQSSCVAAAMRDLRVENYVVTGMSFMSVWLAAGAVLGWL